MDTGIGLDSALKLVSNFGIPGLVLILWYLSDKAHEKTLKQYREDILAQRQIYEDGLKEVRQMYEHNVLLVQNYQSLAGDLKDVVTLNTQQWTGTRDDIKGNQYCPMVRLKKDATGRVG
jgi:hypothetical protein